MSELKSEICQAPKELLKGYRSVAVQTTAGYLLAMGWILTSEETRAVAKNTSSLVLSSFGLLAFAILATTILYSYTARSRCAFDHLDKVFGEDANSLECYKIKIWQSLATSVLIALLAIATFFHLLLASLEPAPRGHEASGEKAIATTPARQYYAIAVFQASPNSTESLGTGRSETQAAPSPTRLDSAVSNTVPIVSISILFLAGGILGGYAGFLQGPPSPENLAEDRKKSLRFRSVVLGVVGAFLVPVFLTIVHATSGNDRDLIDQLSNDADTSDWFVLFGFALLAGVSSQRLISNLTNKFFDDVLARAESAEKTANAARSDVDELDDELGDVAISRSRETILDEPLNEPSTRVLKAIYDAPERRPTKEQIARAGAFQGKEIEQAIQDLEERGLIKSKPLDGTKGWRVRTAGKVLLANLEQTVAGEPAADPS